MSLVDKLKDVHVGDLVLLRDKDNVSNRVGFVFDYSATTIRMSNTITRDKEGKIRRDGFWCRHNEEMVATLPLCWFDSYEVLKKYE